MTMETRLRNVEHVLHSIRYMTGGLSRTDRQAVPEQRKRREPERHV